MENDNDKPRESPAIHTPPPPQVMDPSAHPGAGINKDYSKEKHPQSPGETVAGKKKVKRAVKAVKKKTAAKKVGRKK